MRLNKEDMTNFCNSVKLPHLINLIRTTSEEEIASRSNQIFKAEGPKD